MYSQENKITYSAIFSSVLIKAGMCVIAPTIAVKTLSSLGAQSFINSFDDKPVKPIFTACMLNVIGSDVTNLFEKIYEDSNELYGHYFSENDTENDMNLILNSKVETMACAD